MPRMNVARLTAAAWVLAVLGISGQGASDKPGLVLDTGAFTPFVENMDRSLAFYHDAKAAGYTL